MPRSEDPPLRRLLSYPGAGAYLGVSTRKVKYLAAEGRIRKVRIGNRVLFDVRELDEFIEMLKAEK